MQTKITKHALNATTIIAEAQKTFGEVRATMAKIEEWREDDPLHV